MPDFDAVASVTPEKPSRLQIVLDVTQAAGSTARQYAGSFDFAIPATDGREIERRKGNLVPHLSGPQTSALRNFLDAMLDRAQTTVST